MAAWLFTHTIVPAIIMLMDSKKLEAFLEKRQGKVSFADKMLKALGDFSFNKAKVILAASALLLLTGVIGIYQIRINDNPVKWFKPSHKIRIADEVMNKFFGGTYMAYLVAEGDKEDAIKRPEVMSYIDRLQNHLEGLNIVGKTSSAADIVKRINYVLHNEDKTFDVVPQSQAEIGQYLFLFSMTGDPDDMDNFLDYSSQKANIWVQMKGGENIQMHKVDKSVGNFMKDNPLPEDITIRWSGLTYINMIWQNLMVWGMLKAVLGSFWIVFFLMVIEFRSLRMGFISMLPLTIAIVSSYGFVGFAGRDYDIEAANTFMAGEPYRAIMGNAIVISLGFLPLITSTLTPYVTVGTFFALLMIFSTLATLILLPAIMRLWGKSLFRGRI